MDQGPDVNKKSTKALSVLAGATVLTLGYLLWSAVELMGRLDGIKQRDLRLEELRGVIVHLDEVLTMSARMAAATGDPQWEVRYRSFEPKLKQTFDEALRILPRARTLLVQTDIANIALVGMENRAFEQSRARNLQEAGAILSSNEYKRQKTVYAACMSRLDELLSSAVRGDITSARRHVQGVLIASALALSLLGIFWVVALRAAR